MGKVLKFKTIEEAHNWQVERWFALGKTFLEIDRFERACQKLSLYEPGIYKFKTQKEKFQDQFKRLIKNLENAR